MITINNYRTLFQNIVTAHKQLNTFGFGEVWEIEELTNKDITYPCLFVIPVDSTTTLQTQRRTFRLIVFDMVKKDDVNNAQGTEVWSDTEQILNDLIKIVKLESDTYDLVNEPLLEPFKEEFSDWATGWRADIVIESELNSNYCDVPASSFVSPEATSGTTVTIVDQDGNILATVNGGGSYLVTVLTTINDTITANVTTVVDNII